MASERFETKTVGEGDPIVYGCARMRRLNDRALKFAKTDRPVLILGERGTGKELFARLIHDKSARKSSPYVTFNAGGFDANLARSQLFGHVKGAFTGANDETQGLFQLADGGTLLLDEVGEVPLDLQPLLLRVLQEGEIWKVGASKVETVDVRVVAATNRGTAWLQEPLHFRTDLYDRLGYHIVALPRLCDRGEDVVGIGDAYLKSKGRHLSRDAQAVLLLHDWPGNVRDLYRVLDNAVAVTGRARIEAKDLVEFIHAAFIPVGANLTIARQLRVVAVLFDTRRSWPRVAMTEFLDLPKGSTARVFRALLERGLVVDADGALQLDPDIQRKIDWVQFEAEQYRTILDGPLKEARHFGAIAPGGPSPRARLLQTAYHLLTTDCAGEPDPA